MGTTNTGSWFDQNQPTQLPTQDVQPVPGGSTGEKPAGTSLSSTGPIPWAQVAAGLDPKDPNTLPEMVKRLQAMGYDARIDTRGRSGTRGLSSDKIVVNGQGYDAIIDVDGLNPSFNLNPKPYSLTGGGDAAGGTLGGLMGSGASSQYAAGSAVAPWTKEWNMPTAAQAQGMPGFQYALQRAQQAIERSAAAKGTLLTGGTLRDLSENQIGMGFQQYGQLYDWAKDDYMTDRDNFYNNQDRPFDKYQRLGELGRPV